MDEDKTEDDENRSQTPFAKFWYAITQQKC